MKVAILGSNSFQAQYILRELMQNGIAPDLWGVTPPEEFPSLRFVRFRYPDEPINLADLTGYDCLIYTATAGIHASLKETIELVYELNTFLPVRILNYLSQRNFSGNVITFGSYFEIGNEPEEKYYTEAEVATAFRELPNHYASSKRMFSRYLGSAPGLRGSYHLILPTIYGKGENPNRLIPYLIHSLRNGTEVKVTSGTQMRQYIHAADVARAVVSVCTGAFPSGMYNLCNPEPVQIRSLIQRIYGIMGKSGDFAKLELGMNQRYDTSMPFLLLDDSKTRKVLGFSPKISLEEGLISCL